jgi:peptidoglycan hydrolase-like protein with peptidoglycan-binding domain
MAIFSYLVFSLFFVSGCAMLADENESQTALAVAMPVPASEGENIANFSEATESTGEGDKRLTAASKVPTREEIRFLQEQLKGNGFDPGPLDGIFGLKTRSALSRLQSSCANLKDVVENLDAGLFQQQTVTQTAIPNAPPTKISSNEEVRLLQMRLKDSGFDAGRIDGVHGLKTRAAMLRLQSGCALLKDLPRTLDVNFQTAERPSSRSVADIRVEPDRVIAVDSQTPSKQEIQTVQSRLKDAGFDPGPIDGMLGPRTKQALQQFRNSYGPVNVRKLSSGIGLKLDY